MLVAGVRRPIEHQAALFSRELQLDTCARPYLTDAQANLFCVVDGMLGYGTHTIFVGRVDAIRLHGETRPLIYGDGRFIDS